MFKSKKEMAEWAYYQFKKYGIRMPESYSADEIKQHCPEVPADFTDQYVAKRNSR